MQNNPVSVTTKEDSEMSSAKLVDIPEKVLSNGSGSKEGLNEIEEAEEAMEVNSERELPVEKQNAAKANIDIPARRKSRSSRSVSSNSNSSASVNAPSNSGEKEEDKDKKETSEDESSENEFKGFSDSEPKLLVDLVDHLKKSRTHSESVDTPEQEESTEKNQETPTPSKEKPAQDTSEGDLDESPGADTPTTSSKKQRNAAKKSMTVDLKHPDYKKPFKYGWIRELVYRSTSDNSLRRNADIYYYTPTGKKVRSSREILEHLSGEDLTLDNFTFFKEAIGLDDPTKEIIREAKAKPSSKGAEEGSTPTPRKSLPKSKSVTPAQKYSKDKTITPKVVFRGSTTPKVKPAGKSKLDKKRKSAGPDDVDDVVMVETEDWSPEASDKVTTQLAERQCSIKCRLALGLIPSLMCGYCLCLYHPACVGVSEEKICKPSFAYKCKVCKAKPPAKLVETPREPVPIPTKSEAPAAPSALKVTAQPTLPPAVPHGSAIVDAVTTWFPPETSIQRGNTALEQDNDHPGIYRNKHTATFIGISRKTVVKVNTQENVVGPEVNPGTNIAGLYLIPCDPEQHNGPQSVPLSNGLKRPLDDSSTENEETPPEKIVKMEGTTGGDKEGEEPEGEWEPEPPVNNAHSVVPKVAKGTNDFMWNLNASFSSLLIIFRYLRVHELLQAARVSKLWNYAVSHDSLWDTVRMKNSRVCDWDGFADALIKHKTKNLDLRKILVPDTPEGQSKMWEELCLVLPRISTLTSVDIGRCSPPIFNAIANSTPQIQCLSSTSVRGKEMDLGPLESCTNLKELKIKAISGNMEAKNLSRLANLSRNLTNLALTTIKNLEGIEEYLPENLVSLELGECCSLTPKVANALTKLTKLRRLRLEKGQDECPTIALLEAVSTIQKLRQLELINFDIKPGFDKSLAKCTNLRILLVIPTYVTQSATTNHLVMGGVAKLAPTLNYFIWGLTLELLKVTDLFIGQVDYQKTGSSQRMFKLGNLPKKGSGDSIPILKPNSTEGEAKEAGRGNTSGTSANSQVDILALPNLQRVLSTLLPSTKIKILKIPFSATWRQTISDGYV